MADFQFLPPRGHRARPLALALLVITPFFFGLLAVALGQDANWDLRNYHWYNAYAFLNNRYGQDLLPSQTPYFYNPALDVPFFLLASHVPARMAGFVLGAVQGCNFILLFFLAHAGLALRDAWRRLGASGALALLGMLGGGGIALLGTTFYDNVTSLGFFMSVLLVLRFRDRLFGAAPLRAFFYALLFGLPCGLMVGFKLPSVIFAVGGCFGIFFLGGPFRRRFFLSFAFGAGVLAGAAVSLGPWAWHLQTHFGSPLFPYFNDIFKSPLAPAVSARDVQFLPRSLLEYLTFPFVFAQDPKRVGEISWQDWRLPILYLLLPLAAVAHCVSGRRYTKSMAVPDAAAYLLAVGAISYGVWLMMFSIYRYAIPLEMLAPLLIVLAAGLVPAKLWLQVMLSICLLLAIAVTIQPGNWGRRASWLDRFVEVQIPPLSDTDNLMILMIGFEPYSHVISEFPPDIAFVRVQSNFASPDQNKGINAMIRARVEGHTGRYMVLLPSWQLGLAEDALAVFNLEIIGRSCQTVIDRLYDSDRSRGGSPLSLCNVEPLKMD
ncbi:MAG: hypothetical protein AB7H77_08185 [Bdellovibrionales bacterium]